MLSESEILGAKILIVDDQRMNVQLLEQILRNAGFYNITATTESKEVSDLYESLQPDLVALDLNMPEMDGFDVMKVLKEKEGDSYLPIIVISNEESQEVRFKALESGAKDFLNKPYDRIEVCIRIRNIIEVRLLSNQSRDQNKILENKVKIRTKELYETQQDVIERLARAIEYRDSETGMHIIRMSHYSSCLATEIGLTMKECEILLTAAPLHDIGKIGIPDSILLKQGKLTAEEWIIMKSHTTIGAELLSGSTSQFLTTAKEIALSHHEKWDGSGYPRQLSKKDIPLIGRICGICDVFDALTTARPYKKAWSFNDAMEEIHIQKGVHFDPHMVDAFDKILPSIQFIANKYSDPDLTIPPRDSYEQTL